MTDKIKNLKKTVVILSLIHISFSLERVNKLTELIIPLDRSILYLFLVYKKFIEFIILLRCV